MGKHLYCLSDREWSVIEPLLPKGRRGAHRVSRVKAARLAQPVHRLRGRGSGRGGRWYVSNVPATRSDQGLGSREPGDIALKEGCAPPRETPGTTPRG